MICDAVATLEERRALSQQYVARWFYMTHPNLSWFDDFARNFSSPDVRIWPEDSEGVPEWYSWESRHLDDASSPQDFVDRSAALRAVFDGAMLRTAARL